MRSFSFGTRIGFNLTFLCSGEPGEPGEPETSRLEEESFRELLHIQHTLLGKKTSSYILIFLYSYILIFFYSHILIFLYSFILIYLYSYILIFLYSYILIFLYSYILIF